MSDYTYIIYYVDIDYFSNFLSFIITNGLKR